MTQQPDVNKNILSHTNLGAGNEDKIFLTETTGKRRDLVASVISAISPDVNNYSITSLMDYDSCRPNESSLQGTYCVTFPTNNKPEHLLEQLTVRFKADMAEKATNLADRIFEHVESYAYSQGQGEHLPVSRNITFSSKPSVIDIEGYRVNFTTYKDGYHIVGDPDEEEIRYLGRGLAIFRDALDNIPAGLLGEIGLDL